jgi:purine nucleosidase
MRRILLDTDLAMGEPGSDVDDGFALALAIADPELAVELVTTVGGNSDVDTSTRLTIGLLDRIGQHDIEVVKGAAGPVGPRWRRAASPEAPSTAAAAALVERIMADPGKLTVVAIGPLTNVALALTMEPDLADAIDEIVAMGGVYLKQTNDLSQPGEYNFWCDPEAASMVLESGARLRLVGLDVTEQVRLTRAHTAWLATRGGAFAPYAAVCANEWIDHLQQVKARDESERDSCALHDPLAVAVVQRPELVAWQPARVAVETSSSVTRGVAVADLLWRRDAPQANCRIATAVDAPAFLAHFLDCVGSLP